MIIIGCDYHPGFQQIAYVNTDTGDLSEERLGHKEQAEQFYQGLRTRGLTVRVGMEASGHARWFERLLNELQIELWIGDAAAVRTKRVRKQKTDRQDAQLLLRLLVENRFPRIWMPDAENRDLRQLLWHRHRLVQMRTRVMNQLHVVALNEGLRRKKALWRPTGRAQLESLALAPWASRRRQDLLDLLDQFTPKILELTRGLEEVVEKRPVARRLQPVLSPRHAARAKDRESSDGSETGGRVVLDVAARMGLQRNAAARFARGRARKSPCCAVNHRRNDWVSRSPSPGSSK
jgi:transposase